MNTSPLDHSEEEKEKKIERSGSLHLLCILSILGCCFSMAINLYQIYTLMQHFVRWDDIFYTQNTRFFYLFWGFFLFIPIAMLRLFSVLMMWRLRRMGFYLYLLVCAVGVAFDVFFTLRAEQDTLNSFPSAAPIIGGIASFIFIMLYLSHIKEMK